jgi:hypothetical protein
MNRFSIVLGFGLLLGLFCSGGVAQASSIGPVDRSKDARSPWIERAWDTRYYIELVDGDLWMRKKKRSLVRTPDPGDGSFEWGDYFEPAAIVDLKVSSPIHSSQFAVLLVEFDREGWVTSPHSYPGRLRGRLTRGMSLALSSGDLPSAPKSLLAKWFTGLGDVSTHWAPAFCQPGQYPRPAGITTDNYLYGPKIKLDKYSSKGFGCREWAYQLYDDERPFIDVTSYLPENGSRVAHTYILDVSGWARFGDTKPVIGKQGDYWYCLHDCPNGERPGMIDIKAWTARNGWPLPKPPTRVPTFPDPPAKQGTYPK